MDRGTAPVSILHALEDLPPEAAARFASDAAASPFHGAAWFEILTEACSTPQHRPFIVASQDGGLIAPLALRQDRSGRHLESWTNFYSCDFTPLGGSLQAAAQAALLAAAGARRPNTQHSLFKRWLLHPSIMAYYGHSSGEAAPTSFHGSSGGVNMDAGKIFVGGLSWQTTEESLRYHFEQYGEVQSVEVMRDRNTGDPRGFAFVVFKSDETVDLILKNKPHEINHKVVDVKRAQARGVAPPSIHRDGEVRRGNRVRGLIFATPHTNLTKKMTRFD